MRNTDNATLIAKKLTNTFEQVLNPIGDSPGDHANFDEKTACEDEE